jgi:hypothetical protein
MTNIALFGLHLHHIDVAESSIAGVRPLFYALKRLLDIGSGPAWLQWIVITLPGPVRTACAGATHNARHHARSHAS